MRKKGFVGLEEGRSMSKETPAQKYYDEGFNSKPEDKNPYPKESSRFQLWKEGKWDAKNNV